MNNDNIKIINFNKKNSIIENDNFNDQSVDEIIFSDNNSNNENNAEGFIMDSNNDSIVIEEEVAIKDEDKIYKDDNVYFQELENQILSTYPVTQQGSKFILDRVKLEVNELIEAKNLGIKKFNMLKDNIEYKVIYDLKKNIFDTHWIIPVVNDIHNIFSEVLQKDEDSVNEEEDKFSFSKTKEDISGLKEENQKDLLNELKNIRYKFEDSKIDFQTFLDTEKRFYNSYEINLNSKENGGYVIKAKDNFNVLRIHDLFNVNWNNHKILNEFQTSVNIYDEDGKLKGTRDEKLIKGNEMKIVGFFVLNKGGKNFLNDYDNIYKKNNYSSNNLNKLLYDIKDISEIIQESNSIKIKIENHNLKDDDVIYIDETNCYPKIDNFYGLKNPFKILDKNHIEVKVKKRLEFNGDYGNIMKISKLKYDLYNIDKNYNFKYLRTTYDDTKQNNNHNKLYLFNDIKLDNNKYNDILIKIIPNLNEIIKMEEEELKNIKTYNDVNEIIKNYKININDLYINQFSLLKKYFKNNLKKIKPIDFKSIKYDKINFFPKNIELFKSNYYLANKNIGDNFIVKYYNNYPFYNTNFDNIIERFNWVNNRDDNGLIFYTQLSKLNYKNMENYVKKQINKLKNDMKLLNSNFIEEKNDSKGVEKCSLFKYSAKFINKNINLKDQKDLENETYYFNDENLYYYENEKLNEVKNIENDAKLLTEDKVYIYKNGKWIINNEKSVYNNLKYLCNFKNLDLESLELDSLDCLYEKEIGCSSRISVRYNNKLKEINGFLSNFYKLEKEYKDNEKVKFLDNTIKNIINKYYLKEIDQKKVKIEKKIEYSNSTKLELKPLDILVNSIYKLKNIDMVLYYFFDFIERDGLLINNHIYSKKYKTKTNLCGHYYYLKKIYYCDNPDTRQKYIRLLISKFSDGGEDQLNNHVCKICGQVLIENDYDDTEGFAKSGALIRSREEWTSSDWKRFEEYSDENLEEFLEQTEYLSCENESFKKILLNSGLQIKDIENALSICNFITINLYSKLGIILSSGNLVNIIVDSCQKINLTIPFTLYKNREIKKLLDKGLSMKKIDIMSEKKIFESGYEKFREIKKQCIISARILICIQTIVPNLVIKKKTTSCQFFGFNGNEGLEYMACILQELNNDTPKDKLKLFEIYKNNIEEIYNDFRNTSYIRKLYNEKKKYLQTQKKDYLQIEIENNNYERIFIKEPEKVNIDLNNISKSIKNYSDIVKIKDLIKNRLLFCIQNIKSIIEDVISKSPLSDKYLGGIESSCCSEEADQYIDFYQYINLQSNNKIQNYIDESNSLYNKLKLFYTSGVFHRLYLCDENRFTGIHNTIIVYDGKNCSDNFLKSIFVNYVETGIYAGTLRDYVGQGEDSIDIKSGLSKNEIENKNYSIEELNKLLDIIKIKTLRYYIPSEIEKLPKDVLAKLKKNSLDYIDIHINILLNNIAKLLNKDKEFINEFSEIIKSYGVFNIDKKLKNLNRMDKIKTKNSLYKEKLNYFKKFYINKLRKYLSMIKNNFNIINEDKKLNLIENPDYRLELQSFIYDENTKFEMFYEESTRRYFLDCEIQYPNSEINSIFGIQEIYNFDYSEIIKYSSFNNNDAANVMLYILIKEMNDLFVYNRKDEEKAIYQIDLKNKKNTYMANFVLLLLDELKEDFDQFEICNQNNEIQNSINQDLYEYKMRIMAKDDSYELSRYLSDRSKSTGINKDKKPYEEKDQTAEEFNEELKKQDKLDKVNDKVISDFKKKYGEEPDDEYISESRDRLLEDVNDLEDGEDPDIDGELKNPDVIDQGAEYGGLSEFDFETGEGFVYDE